VQNIIREKEQEGLIEASKTEVKKEQAKKLA
jgi:hypothetical protein